MNDPNKRIDVNISSLLSLKAELLRKQQEVSKTKSKQNIDNFIPKKSIKEKKDIIEEDITELEDSSLLEKSKRVLEAKSKFYDKMASSGGRLNSDDNCLVLFNKKKQYEEHYKNSSSSSDISDDENETGKYGTENENEEWVEYTDCLGRTRKCLKKDLDFFKKKDTRLAENIQPRVEINQNAPMWMIDKVGNGPSTEVNDDLTSEMTSVMSKHDQMKMEWEKKEEENVYKENVHYQDVLFDEARTHGVGYYAFSTDDEERAKQRKELDAIREKTLLLQKEKEAQRTQRQNVIAERVKAAKNRQRARLGLPPIEDEPIPEVPLFNTKEEEKRKKREEKEKRHKERKEKRAEAERKQHIRPWDQEKLSKEKKYNLSKSEQDEEEWNYRPEKTPMSQEQWNEKKRDERNPEFAPKIDDLSHNRFFHSQNDTKISSENEDVTESLYFTTKRQKKTREFIKRNYDSVETQQMSNENDLNNEKYRKRQEIGVEIPPPSTFDYYGPPIKMYTEKPPKQQLEKSIEAGLRFIRDRSDKGMLPTKSTWSANADY